MLMLRFGSQDSLRRREMRPAEAQGSLDSYGGLYPASATTDQRTPDSHRHAPLTVGVL